MIKKIFLLLAAIASSAMAAGQKIPDDPNTTVGKLENGLTYYLRHNSENKGCADFYIIHNVGALQEDDNQNGLAHFLEHMAFNGTERYPDKTILNFLENDGVRFGYNVNAYTSRTETVYNISAVPQTRESFVDSVLFILHDWSCAISCEQDALDAERGVISEEWRRKDEPRALMAELQNNLIYKGAKHTRRNVLGTLDIINGFRRQEILDFYHKWYRPDLQAIAIVGDIDVEDMEKRVKEIFSKIPAQQNPAQKETYDIPAQDGPRFENMLHPMVKVNTLKIIHKQPFPAKEERCSTGFYRDMVLRNIATEILKERFNRATASEGCPAKHIALVTSKASSDFYTSMFTISPKKDDLQEECLAFYAKELKRALDHGFSADELQAARFQTSRKAKIGMDADVKNGEWIKSCIEHFLRGEALISPVEKKEIQAMLAAEVTAEEVFDYMHMMFGDSEKVYSYTIDQKKKEILPSEERMREILAQIEKTPTSPDYPEFQKINLDVRYNNIVTACTEPSDTASYVREMGFGKRGPAVRRMKTRPVKSSNHMVIKAVFNTGFKVLPHDRMESARVAAAYIERNFGFRNYTRKDLRDSPETGNISMMMDIDRDESVITVFCGKEDVKNAINMLYLTITEPYFDSEKNLERFKEMQIKLLGKERSDKSVYDEADHKMRYGDHPWRREITAEHYEDLDMNLIKDVFERSFGDAGRLTLYVCDDLSHEASISSNLYNMVFSLPAKKTKDRIKGERHESWPLYRGKHRHVKEHKLKTVPKSEVTLSFKYDIRLKSKEFIIFDILDYIMDARCMNRIREERGGTYSVTFSTETFLEGKKAESSIVFQTRPEMTDILVDDARNLMEEMAAEGPTEEEFDNARKYLAKHHIELSDRDRNNLSKKLDRYMMKDRYGIDKQGDYLEMLDKLSRKDILKMARRIVKGDSILSVYTEN